jgi:hypothetical protein
MADPLGYLIVRDENGLVVADWDATIHPSYERACRELIECRQQEQLYTWYLAELHPAEGPEVPF